jgi:uncharacterized protein (TIGR00106 family)
MLMELSTIPLGRGRSISADVADIVKIIDGSGLDYRLTAAGSIIEGTWDQLMDLAKRCHQAMRGKTERVITLIKIDDYEQRTGRLTAAVKSVEDKVGKPVKKGA